MQLGELEHMRLDLLEHRRGGAEEDHAVQVHDEHGGAVLLEDLRLEARALHLRALEQQRSAQQHARMRRVLDDEDGGGEEHAEHDGPEHTEQCGEDDVKDN